MSDHSFDHSLLAAVPEWWPLAMAVLIALGAIVWVDRRPEGEVHEPKKGEHYDR